MTTTDNGAPPRAIATALNGIGIVGVAPNVKIAASKPAMQRILFP
jgi:hypothetical protein